MNAIVPKNGSLDPAIVSSLVIGGDLKRLSNEQKIAYYKYRCQQVGLDPSAKPFDLLTLNGKEVLYANAGCTQQLCQIHGLSPTITDRAVVEGIYCVTSRVTGGGRTTENMGAVPVGGLKGDHLANAMMKAITKAHRRTILMHCGLGMLDETEVETIPGAQTTPSNFRDEARQIVSEMDACGERDQLDAYFASKEILDWLARADAAVAGKSAMSQGDYVRQMFHQIRDKLPDKKVDKRTLIKSTDEYGSKPEVQPEPDPLAAIGERASALLDRIDIAEAGDMPSIAEDAKKAKDAGELTAAEAELIQKSYGARARKMKRAA
jgi:hypothetical protein